MKPETKEIFDQIEREEKRKTIKGIILAIGLFIGALLIMAYAYDPYSPTNTQYKGIIISAFKPDSENRILNIVYSVKLETGETVQVNGARVGAIKIKSAILVEQLVSKRFKKKRYRFIKHIQLNEVEELNFVSPFD